MKKYSYALLLVLGLVSIGMFPSCKNKNPSVAKIFVRSASNLLLPAAKVVLIADIQENEYSGEFVDTLVTNSEGYVEFDISEYYTAAGKKIEVGNFDIIAQKENKTGTGYIRTRVHSTAVETVFLQE